IVRGIVDRAEEDAVQTQQTGRLVQLVLVLAAHGHFDDRRKMLLEPRFVHRHVVPWVHPNMLPEYDRSERYFNSIRTFSRYLTDAPALIAGLYFQLRTADNRRRS